MCNVAKLCCMGVTAADFVNLPMFCRLFLWYFTVRVCVCVGVEVGFRVQSASSFGRWTKWLTGRLLFKKNVGYVLRVTLIWFFFSICFLFYHGPKWYKLLCCNIPICFVIFLMKVWRPLAVGAPIRTLFYMPLDNIVRRCFDTLLLATPRLLLTSGRF